MRHEQHYTLLLLKYFLTYKNILKFILQKLAVKNNQLKKKKVKYYHLKIVIKTNMEFQDNNIVRNLIKCINFAAVKHQNQRRINKAATPYINHPIGVAHILTQEGLIDDLNVIQAAILHDTIEDTDTTFEELKSQFGPRVAEIVQECTDDKRLPKQERKNLQIINARNSSHEAKLVKLADKLYNLRDLDVETPVGWTQERVDEYFIWAAKVVEGLIGTNNEIEQKLKDIFHKHNVNV